MEDLTSAGLTLRSHPVAHLGAGLISQLEEGEHSVATDFPLCHLLFSILYRDLELNHRSHCRRGGVYSRVPHFGSTRGLAKHQMLLFNSFNLLNVYLASASFFCKFLNLNSLTLDSCVLE